MGLEPDPAHLAIGVVNGDLNDRTTDFINASVGSEIIEPREFHSEGSGLVQIPQLSVQAIMSAHDMAMLDLLHCDVQGAETEVLASCMPLLERGAIRLCVVSTHHRYISGDALTHQRCLALIKGAGGKILAEHSVAESFSGDGLIAAYFGAEPLYWQEPKITYNRAAESLFRDTLFDLAAHQ